MNSYNTSPVKTTVLNNFNVLVTRSPSRTVKNTSLNFKHYEIICNNGYEQLENKENIFDNRIILPRSPSKAKVEKVLIDLPSLKF
jgi:hypothetical protein